MIPASLSALMLRCKTPMATKCAATCAAICQVTMTALMESRRFLLAAISSCSIRLASKILFLSNHCCAGKTVPDWKDAVSKDATILVHMPGADCEGLTAKLRAAGLEAQTPCLLASYATSAQQQVHPLTDLAKPPSRARIACDRGC